MLSLLLKIKLVIKKKIQIVKKIFYIQKTYKTIYLEGFFKKNTKNFGIEKILVYLVL